MTCPWRRREACPSHPQKVRTMAGHGGVSSVLSAGQPRVRGSSLTPKVREYSDPMGTQGAPHIPLGCDPGTLISPEDYWDWPIGNLGSSLGPCTPLPILLEVLLVRDPGTAWATRSMSRSEMSQGDMSFLQPLFFCEGWDSAWLVLPGFFLTPQPSSSPTPTLCPPPEWQAQQ